MKKIRRRLWLLLAAAATVILLAVLALPFLVDAERFRGLIEERAEEALGRDVRLGDVQLSILPALGLRAVDVAVGALPEEGGGDLMTATGLRIGARLMPLLSGRLEVTGIVLEEPSMVLARDAEGRWNVEHLVAGTAATDEDAPDGDATANEAAAAREIQVATLRLTDGRLTVRDASVPDRPVEIVLTDLDLALDDVGPGVISSFELETAFESLPGARLEMAGKGGPLIAGVNPEGSESSHVDARFEVDDITGALLADLAGIAGVSLEGVLGDRPFDASGHVDAELGDRSRIKLEDIELEDIDLVLARDRDGSWNVERIGAADVPAEGGSELSIDSLRLKGGRLTLRDVAAPYQIVLTDLGVELRDFQPGSSSSFELKTSFESAAGARLEISGDGSLAGAEDGQAQRLEADVKLEAMGGKLLAELAAAAGVSLEGALGERPLDASARLDADLGPAGRITVADLEISDADLDLRRDPAGRWNFELGESSSGDDAWPLEVRGVTIAGARVRLRDESAGTEPFDATFDDLRLELDRLPVDGPVAIRLTASVSGEGGRGSLEIEGNVGPLGDGGRPTPLELSVNLRQLPLAVVRPWLEALAGAGSAVGKADLDLRLAGSFPAAYDAAGTLDLAGARFDTGERSMNLDFGVRFDVAGRRGVEALDFKALELDYEGASDGGPVSGGTLALSGSVEEVAGGRRWDMSLAPTRLPAADLAALLELMVADFSMSFDSATPVAIEARAEGLETADRLPDLKGRVELRGFHFQHPSLARPIEKVDADVVFEGESVWVTGLAATVGGSELTGDLTLTGWQRPSVTFDLSSPRADLGEVLSAFESTAADTASGDPSGPNLLEQITADGDLRIGDGAWDTLEFNDLTTRVRLAGGVMTLDPVALKLYDGAYDGRVVADLRVTPAAFEIEGKADRVDVAPFLAANLEVQNALFGSFTGDVQARGAGDDYDSIVGSLAGGGSARLDQGRLGRLDLLGTVARVSGVLGQRTLASLAGRIANQSTRFERLEGKFQLAGGKLTVTELILESPDFGLTGEAELGLLAAGVGGKFQLAFSELLSDSMQREASRAGELFWNPDSRRVEMPLALAGSVDSPVATVDWSGAVKRYATGRAVRELTGLLGKVLGGDEQEDERETSGAPPVGEPESWDREPLGVEIDRVRWGGSILLQDLKLEGTVRGRELDRATLVAVDANGTEVERLGRLAAVDAYLSNAVDPRAEVEIRWEARVDGKDLVLAAFPLTVRVTVYDRSGDSAEASVTVEQ